LYAQKGKGWKINKFMVAKLSFFPPYYITQAFSFSSFVHVLRKEKLEKENGK
jgi:hypothetical protein